MDGMLVKSALEHVALASRRVASFSSDVREKDDRVARSRTDTRLNRGWKSCAVRARRSRSNPGHVQMDGGAHAPTRTDRPTRPDPTRPGPTPLAYRYDVFIKNSFTWPFFSPLYLLPTFNVPLLFPPRLYQISLINHCSTLKFISRQTLRTEKVNTYA